MDFTHYFSWLKTTYWLATSTFFFWVNNVHVSWTLLVTSSSFLRKVNTNTCLKRTSKQKSTLKNKNSSRCFQDSALKAPFKALIVSRSLQGVVSSLHPGVFGRLLWPPGWVGFLPAGNRWSFGNHHWYRNLVQYFTG